MNIKEKKKYRKKILLLGGYGYGNVGDEAQLSASYDELSRRFPNSMIKVLTPNQSYTYTEHDKCLVADAPRVAFYDEGNSPLYGIRNRYENSPIKFLGNEVYKRVFILRSYWIMINTHFVKINLPTFLLNSKRSALLHELKTADLVFFVGGGYLTGRTLSRLWDGMFFISYAHILNVPVALSGQTIGSWGNNFNRHIAKKNLSKASIITCRDADDSIDALNDLGLDKEKYFTTCDDALFCKKTGNEEEIVNVLFESKLSKEEIDKGYITLNFHYWGLFTKDEKSILFNKISNLIDGIRKYSDKPIVLIPMSPSDDPPMDDFLQQFNVEKVYKLKYDFDFQIIRGIIGKSEVCLTMKHHPIIFAIGEKVPVISLTQSEYYKHKNGGALGLFGLEKYSVMLEKDSYLDEFDEKFKEVNENKVEIIHKISCRLDDIKEKQNYFFDKVKSLI